MVAVQDVRENPAIVVLVPRTTESLLLLLLLESPILAGLILSGALPSRSFS